MSTKKGRPHADKGAAPRLQAAVNSLEELSSIGPNTANMCWDLADALRSARAHLAQLCEEIEHGKGLATSEDTCPQELDSVAAWYRKHDDSDRAELLMQPDSLEMEYDRFLLWMPNVMRKLHEFMMKRWPGRASDPFHPKHNKWKRKLRLKIHLTAAKILRSRSAFH